MRKVMKLLLSLFIAGGLTGCSPKANRHEGLHIVTTIFPVYDWVRQVVGEEDVDVTLLLDNGVDLHSYQPTAKDIMQISTCDIFLYVGGESDAWVKDALDGTVNKDMIVINLLETLGDQAKDEETVEGMQAEEDEGVKDEHVWLSLRNAFLFVGAIKKALVEKDRAHSAAYEANAKRYQEELEQLDKGYQDVIKHARYDTLVFGDRFPLRYLVDDYHLKYYAAFAGCSAETEASFETIRFLAKKLDELSLPCVMTIDGSSQKIAETIVANTKKKNQKILTFNSMQSVIKKDDYLSIMKKNLDILREALGRG